MKNVNKLENTVMTLLATLIMATSIAVFYKPAGLTLGGVSGMALVVYNVFGINTSSTILLFNASLLVLGLIFLSKECVANTILGSIAFPLFLSLIEKLEIGVTNYYVSCVVGPILMAIACFILISYNSSSGGSDSLGLIINKLTGIKIVSIMFVFDATVLLLSIIYLNPMTLCLSLVSLVIQMSLINLFNKLSVSVNTKKENLI